MISIIPLPHLLNEHTPFKIVKVVSAQAVHTVELWQYKHPEAHGKHCPLLIKEPVDPVGGLQETQLVRLVQCAHPGPHGEHCPLLT